MQRQSALSASSYYCRTASLIAFSLWLCAPVLDASARVDNFTRAWQFLKAAYPELRGKGHGLAISNNYWRNFDVSAGPLRSFALLVNRARAQTSSTSDELLMTAHFEFADDQFLDEFSAAGSPMLHGEELEKMAALVLNNRGMTIEAVGTALTTAGARFGPRQEKDLRATVEATIAAVTFAVGRAKVVSVEWWQVDTTCWRVDLEARQGKNVREYGAVFEPFEGKLLYLKRGNSRAR